MLGIGVQGFKLWGVNGLGCRVLGHATKGLESCTAIQPTCADSQKADFLQQHIPGPKQSPSQKHGACTQKTPCTTSNDACQRYLFWNFVDDVRFVEVPVGGYNFPQQEKGQGANPTPEGYADGLPKKEPW